MMFRVIRRDGAANNDALEEVEHDSPPMLPELAVGLRVVGLCRVIAIRPKVTVVPPVRGSITRIQHF